MKRPLADKRIVGPIFKSSTQESREFDKIIIEVNDGLPRYTVVGKYKTRGTITTGLSIDTNSIVVNGLTSLSAEDRVEMLAESDSKLSIVERTENLVNIEV